MIMQSESRAHLLEWLDRLAYELSVFASGREGAPQGLRSRLHEATRLTLVYRAELTAVFNELFGPDPRKKPEDPTGVTP